MNTLLNSKAVLSAPPSFIASLASFGIFKFKLVYGDPWKTIIEIDFKRDPKLPHDWMMKLPIYEDK